MDKMDLQQVERVPDVLLFIIDLILFQTNKCNVRVCSNKIVNQRHRKCATSTGQHSTVANMCLYIIHACMWQEKQKQHI